MTLYDQQVLDIIDGLLDHEQVNVNTRVSYLRERRGVTSVRALGPIVDRYLAIKDPPQLCQVEHDHWEGKMICGNTLPCRTHGGR